MSQKIFSGDEQRKVSKAFANVAENWILYDTVLIGGFVSSMDYNTGWYTTFTAAAAATQIPFFNVRNRSHGIPYNNQDTRDQLPYVFKIYSIGVNFFAPSTTTYFTGSTTIFAAQTLSNSLFEMELPKHCSLTLRTNQDERLIANSLMTPSGYGVIPGGVAQGDYETAYTYPNVAHTSFSQGVPELTNKWGFPKPLEIPRTANLSVTLRLSEYAQHLLTQLPGPYFQPMRNLADDDYTDSYGCAGIQVTLGGVREVQQRGQYHA
jgi:hypothetical protein